MNSNAMQPQTGTLSPGGATPTNTGSTGAGATAEVPGNEAGGPGSTERQIRRSRRTRNFALIWALVLVLYWVGSVILRELSEPNYELWGTPQESWVQQAPVALQPFLQNALFAGERGPMDLLKSQWVIVWSLLVFSWWVYNLDVQAQTRVRLRYLLAWLLGFVALGWIIGSILQALVPSNLPTVEVSILYELGPLFLIWTTVIFLIYLFKGDGSQGHHDYLSPYQGILTAFSAVLLAVLLTGFSAFRTVNNRVAGEMSTTTLALRTVEQLGVEAQRTLQTTRILVDPENIPNVESFLSIDASVPFADIEIAKGPPTDDKVLAHFLPSLRHDVVRLRDTAHSAAALIQVAASDLEPGPFRESLRRLQSVVSHTISASSPMTSTLAQIEMLTASMLQIDSAKYLNLDKQNSLLLPYVKDTATEDGAIYTEYENIPPEIQQQVVELQAESDKLFAQYDTLNFSTTQLLRTELLTSAEATNEKATVAAQTIQGIGPNGVSLFLWIGLLYAAMVLFPWLLLLMFIYRKQRDRAVQIYKDLRRLDPSSDLLKRALGLAGAIGQDLNSEQTRLLSHVNALLPLDSPKDHDEVAPIIENGRIKINASGEVEVERVDHMLIVRGLATRAFNNFEYVLSVLLVTLIAAVGWYYLFYPQGGEGLARLIGAGGGIKEVTEHMIQNITPLTLGFVGAYFFLIQMLLRRYLAGDLYPSAYLQTAVRMLVVFIISLLLTFLLSGNTDTLPGTFAAGASFFAGIFPRSGLTLGARLVNRAMEAVSTGTKYPEAIDTKPLTILDGVNAWAETRLVEENIENLQSMATAPIEQLVLGTYYPTLQIVDWIDQSILYNHCGHEGEWFRVYRSIGIRTATDLLDAAGYKLGIPPDKQLVDWEPGRERVEAISSAITSAQLSTATPSGGVRSAIKQWGAIYAQQVNKAKSRSVQMAELLKGINVEKRETYDYIYGLQQYARFAGETTEEVLRATDELSSLVGTMSGDNADKIQAVQDMSQFRSCAKETAEGSHEAQKLIEPLSLDVSTLKDLDLVIDAVQTWYARLLQLEQQFSVLEIFLLGAAASETNALTAGINEKLTALRGAISKVRESTSSVWHRIQTIDADQPATLDAISELQGHFAELSTVVDRLTMGQSDTLKVIKAADIESREKAALIAALNEDATEFPKMQEAMDAIDQALGLLNPSRLSSASLEETSLAVGQLRQIIDAVTPRSQVVSAATASVLGVTTLSSDIIYQTCEAIWPDPNLNYILNFYYYNTYSAQAHGTD